MLKRKVLSLLFLLAAALGHAQSLQLYEYWVDLDYTKHTTVRSSQTDIAFQVDVSQIEPGIHYLNFRPQNSDGVWGWISRYLFYVPEPTSTDATLTHYQYWLDNDYSSQTTVANTSGGDIALPIDISSLTNGVHYFNFRARKSEGVWGNLSRYLFYVPEPTSTDATLTHYQYWLDNDYSSQTTVANTNSGDIALPIDISSLTNGVHYFNFRARNSDGVWGNLSRYLFYVPELTTADATLTDLEYWIDDDYAGRTAQKASADFFASIDISQMAPGVHYFNFRARNSDGVWGNLSRYLFYVPDGSSSTSSPITGYRYSFNNRYTYVPLSDRTELELTDFLIDIPELKEMGSLEEGCTYTFDPAAATVHFSREAQVSFAMQFKNKNEEWSAPVATQFDMSDSYDKPFVELPVQRQLRLDKVADGDFQAVSMTLTESRNYFFKASEACRLMLFEANGQLLTTIAAEQLLDTYQIGLTKGTYYGIVYNTVKDAENPSDAITLKLMLTDNVVPTPAINYEQETVTISCDEPTATIYYTLDGSEPTTSSTRYAAPFALRRNAVVKAIAVADGMADSDIATLTVDSYKVATPTIEFTNLRLYMECATEDAAIFYTLDGSDPTMNGQRYTEPIAVSSNCTARAVGKRDGYNNSEVASLAVDVTNVKTATPTITREGDGLRIGCRTEGATLHYSTDGSTPTASSPTVAADGFLQPAKNGTVSVVAMKSGELPSDIATITVDWLQVATPLLSYDAATSLLTMTCTTPGATIYYELGGADPTPDSDSGPSGLTLLLTDNRVVKAMAVAADLNRSDIATYSPGTFTVEPVEMAFDGLHLTMSCATEGATIHYQLGRGLEGSGIYTDAITITRTGSATAWAEKADMNSSVQTYLTIASCFDGETAHTSAGHLKDAFQWCPTERVKRLTVNGSIDEADLAFLRSLPVIDHLDLSAVRLASEQLPAEAFQGMPLLSISVPTQLSGAGDELFKDCRRLAAITWTPSFRLTEQMLSGVDNPNLLLYVKTATDAPSAAQNVVTGGVAASITLTDADGNANFYVPTPFTAQHISYTHDYTMPTVVGQCQGWETLFLPFNVTSINHETKGRLAPFAAHDERAKPFWLCVLNGNISFEPAAQIEAFTPYIISMPNSTDYADSYILGGKVTFEAENVRVENRWLIDIANKHMEGTFVAKDKEPGMMVLNAGEAYDGYAEGSAFFRDLNRPVRPFQAYVAEGIAGSRVFAIGPSLPTSIEELPAITSTDMEPEKVVFDLQGRRVATQQQPLGKGIYISGGRKVLVR